MYQKNLSLVVYKWLIIKLNVNSHFNAKSDLCLEQCSNHKYKTIKEMA